MKRNKENQEQEWKIAKKAVYGFLLFISSLVIVSFNRWLGFAAFLFGLVLFLYQLLKLSKFKETYED